MKGPEIDADLLVVRISEAGARLVGRQLAGRGAVVPTDEPWQVGARRLIEVYNSGTDLGRARLRLLSPALRDFMGLGAPSHPAVDVEDPDEIALDIDGYI